MLTANLLLTLLRWH